MPFVPIGNGKYRSPSGRIMTLEQVKAYYAKQSRKKKRKSKRK